MDTRHNLYDQYDKEDISKLLFKNKKAQRLEIINKFIYKSKNERYQNIEIPQERLYVKNTINYRYYLYITCGLTNVILYNALFKGVYSINNLYWNPKTLPFWTKAGLTTLFCYYIFKSKWDDYIYSPELYRLSITS